MRTFMRAVALRLRLRNAEVYDEDLSPLEYDMRAINDRFHRAAVKTGWTRAELAKRFGMNPEIPLAQQPADKIPRPTMRTIVKACEMLGVSTAWVLYGEPQNEVDLYVDSPVGKVGAGPSIHGSAVVQGNAQSKIVVNHIQGDTLSAQEREVLETFRRLSIRDQAAVMMYVFEMANDCQ